MSTFREQIEDAIDAARATDLRPLASTIVHMALRLDPGLTVKELNGVRDDVMLAVGVQLGDGTATPTVANQLGRIVSNKLRDLQRAAVKERRHLASADSVAMLADLAGRDRVEDEIVDQEACAVITAALQQLRAEHRRSYEAIYAQLNGLRIAQHLATVFGESVSDQTARKTLERARDRLSIILAARAEKVS